MGIGFGVLAGATALVIGVWSYRTTSRFISAADSVSHTHQVIEALERIRSLMDEAESSQRGFLLTGNEQFHLSFDSVVNRVPEKLAHLKELTADNIPQHQRVEELDELIKVHLELARGSFAARASAGSQASPNLASVIFSEQDATALRELIQEMKSEERGLLAQRIARTETARHILLVLILSGGLLTVMLVGLTGYGIRSDVIGRRRAEETLETSRARQAIIVESLPIVLYAAVPTGHYEPTWISQSAERITGFPLSQFLTNATFWASRLHPEDREATLRMFGALSSTGSLTVEYRWQVADGSFRWFSDRALFVRGPNGEPKEIFGLWEDITERKRLTEALHESKETLEAVFRAAPLAVTAVSADGNVIMWNRAAEQLFGWTADEVLGHPLPTVPAEKAEEHHAFRERVLRGETFTGYEVRRKRKDGAWIDVSLSAAPLRDGRGMVTGAMGLLEDISERKRAAQQLRLQAQIIDQIHDSVVSTDLDGNVTSWNKGAERLFGYAANEAMGRHISFVYPPEEHEFLAEQVIAPLKRKGSHEVEVRMRKLSGEDFWAHLALSMLSDPAEKVIGMIGYSMDITERRRAQIALQESREQLRAFAARLESIREEERTRISREVHDELGQVLTAL